MSARPPLRRLTRHAGLRAPVLAAMTLLAAAGCGDVADDCLTGDLRLCLCADGSEGRRVCADGAFGACSCAAPDGGAASDAAPLADASDRGASDAQSADSAGGADTSPADTSPADTGPAKACTVDADCPDDGDLCNGVPACVDHVCQLKAGSAVLCDPSKSTVCAEHRCDPSTGTCGLTPRPDGTPCTDGDACTVEDSCKAGVCAAGPQNQCQCTTDTDCVAFEDGDLCNGTLVCDTKSFPFACVVSAPSVVVCDASQDTACASNTCDPASGLCALAAEATGTACDDGDPCTAKDACADGTCEGAQTTCQCQSDADCAKLDDGNLCNGSLVCDKSTPGAFTCAVDLSSAVSCDTSGDTACAKNVCQPSKGTCAVQHVKDQTFCDDGEPCSVKDVCLKGTCSAGPWACGCKTDSDCAQADKCAGSFACVTDKAGWKGCQLKPGTPVVCDSSKDTPCLKNTCVPATGSCAPQPVAGNKPCDDGVPCTSNDTCSGGSCSGTWACQCNPADGGKACAAKEDGNLCNGTLTCVAGSGLFTCKVDPKTVVSCSAAGDTACATNTCTPKTGACSLVAKPDNTACDDGDPCTGGDVCAAGTCKGPTKTCTTGPTWSEVYQAAFANEGCGGCHGSYNGAQTTYDTLTQQTFCGAPLVKAGDSAGSSIVWKMVAGVNLPGSCGEKMPKGASGISASAAKLLQDWIKAGAKK